MLLLLDFLKQGKKKRLEFLRQAGQNPLRNGHSAKIWTVAAYLIVQRNPQAQVRNRGGPLDTMLVGENLKVIVHGKGIVKESTVSSL